MKPDHFKPPEFRAAIITVSSSRIPETDTSGNKIRELLTLEHIPVVHYAIVSDRVDAIRSELATALDLANCVILNGGTGLTHDDCTIEAVTPLLEKRIDGFGALFRLKSFEEIGTSAILSRAVAGVIRGKVVFCIPGSTGAVTLAMKEIILPELGHILTHANK
ncbi:MAG: MogA/MoaB family molybdenum cofactor biosynthesis protein [Methanoregulaceae archaeon]